MPQNTVNAKNGVISPCGTRAENRVSRGARQLDLFRQDRQLTVSRRWKRADQARQEDALCPAEVDALCRTLKTLRRLMLFRGEAS